jgi:hypothetical protein
MGPEDVIERCVPGRAARGPARTVLGKPEIFLRIILTFRKKTLCFLRNLLLRDHMVKANRISWERESYFDDIYGGNVATLPRHKFIYLGDQTNLCNSVYSAWRDHWREYCSDEEVDLEVLIVGGTVVLWRKGSAEVKPRVL